MGSNPSTRMEVEAGKALIEAPRPKHPVYFNTANLFASGMAELDRADQAIGFLFAQRQREVKSGKITWDELLLSPMFRPLAPPDVLVPVAAGYGPRFEELYEAETGKFLGKARDVLKARTTLSLWSLGALAADRMRQCRAFTFESIEQVQALRETPLPSRDWEMDNLKLPFDDLFIDLKGILPIDITTINRWKGGEEVVTFRPRALFITHIEERGTLEGSVDVVLKDSAGNPVKSGAVSPTDVDWRRRIQIVTIMVATDTLPAWLKAIASGPLTLGCHLFWHWRPGDTFDATMRGVGDPKDHPFWEFLAKTILFMNSPGIVEERPQSTAYLRHVAGEVKYRGADPSVKVLLIRPRHTYTPNREPGAPPHFRFSYRFDVRGHYKHYRRGPMAGRVIYCPPFIKGPGDKPYRPSLRVLVGERKLEPADV